eukprot:4704265-Heterocapsa_arctica.AAC.1
MLALPHIAGVVLFYSFARDYGYVRPDEGGRDALIHREYISDGRNVRFGDRILFTAVLQPGVPSPIATHISGGSGSTDLVWQDDAEACTWEEGNLVLGRVSFHCNHR